MFDQLSHIKKCYSLEAIDPRPHWFTYSGKNECLKEKARWDYSEDYKKLLREGYPPELAKSIIVYTHLL